MFKLPSPLPDTTRRLTAPSFVVQLDGHIIQARDHGTKHDGIVEGKLHCSWGSVRFVPVCPGFSSIDAAFVADLLTVSL